MAILMVTQPILSQESGGSWKLVKGPNGYSEVSARSEITAPQGAGFAILKIKRQPGVTPPVIVYLIVESPRRLPMFPFEKYDGPVDKTHNEFMTFEVPSGDRSRILSLKLMPNGFYGVDPPDAFVFDTIDNKVVPFLLEAKDGQKLTVGVNGPPTSIQVSFDTTGLKQLLDQMGLKTVQSFTKRNVK
jgi:hypothetical protein